MTTLTLKKEAKISSHTGDASIERFLGCCVDASEKELLSDYDCDIRYHPGKANVVADALSRKEREKATLRVQSLVHDFSVDLTKRFLSVRLKRERKPVTLE
ncbi:hypothetical protein Tco_0072784 [Tanacetum coccineum]